MPKSVLELFSQKEVLNYLKERKFPALMGEELFPETKKQSLEFDVLTNASKTPVIASVHGFDTESEIGQREAEKKAVELALIKRKMQLKEKEIIALESPRNDAERQALMKDVYNDFDNLYPWSDIITYNYDTKNKKITAFYGEPGFKFDGTNGEVLTRIPEFWFKREVKGDYEYIYISDYNRAGYKHSKEFSVGRYGISIDAEGNAHSISGTIPAYNKTIAAFRTLATAVGEGFCQMDTRYFILQLLYLVEYADYNSQSKLGRGVSEWFNQKALIAENNVNRIIVANSSNMYVGRNVSIGATDAWNNSVASERTITKIEEFSNGSVTGKAVYFDGAAVNIAVGNALWGIGQKAGQCDELGMKSGCLSNDGCHSVIYRGIENVFSNMFTAIDGLNIKDYVAYVCDDPTQYASDKFVAPYKPVGYTNLKQTNCYTSKLGYDENYPEIAIPIESNGSSGTGTCDYYWCAEGNRIAFAGGSFSGGAGDGFFYLGLSGGSGNSSWNFGARLLKYQ